MVLMKIFRMMVFVVLLCVAGFIGYMIPHSLNCGSTNTAINKTGNAKVIPRQDFYGVVVSRKDSMLSIKKVSNTGEMKNTELNVKLTNQTKLTYQKPQDIKRGWQFLPIQGNINDIKVGYFVRIIGTGDTISCNSSTSSIDASSVQYSEKSPFISNVKNVK